MFDTDLPAYEAFEQAKCKEEFRSRERFELRLKAKASRTLRKYGNCTADAWGREEAALAKRLLGHMQVETARARRRAGLDGDEDAWPWDDVSVPPVDEQFQLALAKECPARGAAHEEAARVCERLRDPLHMPAVLEAIGCLIPKSLHRSLDGVKPRGKAQAGAAMGAPTLQAGTWKLDVDDEKSIGLAGRPMSKGVLEFSWCCFDTCAPFCGCPVAWVRTRSANEYSLRRQVIRCCAMWPRRRRGAVKVV
jgi:hypothetical protein